ncbi:RF-1 domain-containing protein [Colletotrichum orchidophilum]|uniref:RF-1 domain-containing protein n=1 Tax=Colletotrichum orchidophilum TaxID=1209926 RepID=A0A1G4APG8_9PEZI|nr:RF-1 domain-containing protein [Colletotrichum orchidophilum]OHE91078.1 RF-1 domain-containing protein [Colletotrichum orchidophilum]
MPPPLPLLTRLPLLAGASNANAFMRHGLTAARPPLPLQPSLLVALFSASPSAALKKHEMPPRPKPPPDSDIEESYLKGSGPGGQKINKTSSAVQLKHIPTGIVVKSQATRSRSQNRKIAREILAQKIDDLQNGDQSRSAIVGDVKRKKAASASKKSKRKYRLLEEEKANSEASEAGASEPIVEDQTNSNPSSEEKTSIADPSSTVQSKNL